MMNRSLYYIIFMIALSGGIEASDKKTMIITKAKGGFFACFFGVLNNIRWCEKKCVTPTVKWGETSLYYEPEGYNDSCEPWEYYFEPISPVCCEEVLKRKDTFIHPHDASPDGKRIPPTFNSQYLNSLKKSYRESMHRTIKDHIRIKPVILHKINTFYEEHLLGKKTVGIHIRGTDKRKENRPVTVESVCAIANTLARDYPNCQFFVATDEERVLIKAKELLKGPVVQYDSFRSLNGKGIHNSRHSYNRAKLGEEVLIETLLLSKCDKFVHTRSNVSTAVLYFNPDLESTLVD